MTITSVCACASFTLRRTSSPSPPFPMRRSVITTSKSPPATARCAEATFSACSTAYPSAVRRMSSIVRMLSLSSTTRSRAIDVTLPRACRAHRFFAFGQGERHRERAAPARLAAHRDAAAVAFDDPVDDGEAQPGAVGLGGEERVEDAGQVVSRDPLSGILHLQERLPGLPAQLDRDAAARLGRVA